MSNLIRLSRVVHDSKTLEKFTNLYNTASAGKTFHFWSEHLLTHEELIENRKKTTLPHLFCCHANEDKAIKDFIANFNTRVIVGKIPKNNELAVGRIKVHSSTAFIINENVYPTYTASYFEEKYNLRKNNILEVEIDDYINENITTIIQNISTFLGVQLPINDCLTLHKLWLEKAF